MEQLSILLWTLLNRFIGTEEQVYIRRTYSETWEELFACNPDEKFPYIYLDSGSRAEGLSLPGSDYDRMWILKSVSVLPAEFAMQMPNLVIETTGVKSGFAKLRLFAGNLDLFHKLETFRNGIVKFNGSFYLSSLLFRDNVVANFNKKKAGYTPHGPCATYSISTGTCNVELDILLCFPSILWPIEASEWIHIHRPNNWPSRELIQTIVNNSCLLVPIGNPQSPDCHMEWRMSFSLAEKKLVYSFNHTQFLCYGLLKLYLKHVIESNQEIKGLLCSYFLKTCLFYCIEEEHITWDKKNFIECFLVCLRRLTAWVRNGYCPNYFMKRNNMFEGKIYGEKQKKLVEYLSKLCEDGISTVIGIPCLSDLRTGVELVLLTSKIVEMSRTEREFRCDKEFIGLSCDGSLRDAKFLIQFKVNLQTLATQTCASQLKHTFIKTFHGLVNLSLTQYIYKTIVDTQSSNKSHYRRLKLFKNHITHSCTHNDICAGWLQYATLCYITGQFSKVVRIVEYILAKFKMYTIYNVVGPQLINCIDEEYVKEMCDRGLTIHQKMKRALAFSYYCLPDYGFYPSEIACEIAHNSVKGAVSIPPIVYSNILSFLSYKHMRCNDQRHNSLNELYVSTQDEHFVSEVEKSLSCKLLAKCAALV